MSEANLLHYLGWCLAKLYKTSNQVQTVKVEKLL